MELQGWANHGSSRLKREGHKLQCSWYDQHLGCISIPLFGFKRGRAMERLEFDIATFAITHTLFPLEKMKDQVKEL